jgi:hypothetical protein
MMRVAKGNSDLSRMYEGFAFAVERMSLFGLGCAPELKLVRLFFF